MKNLILTGGIFHPFDEAASALDQLLIQEGFDSEITQDIEDGLKKLDQDRYDLLTVYTLRWSMQTGEKYEPYRDQWALILSETGRQAIWNFLERGGGILALHTAAICYDGWKEWCKILGAQWIWGKSGHPPYGKTYVRSGSEEHPITKNIQSFELEDEVYSNMELEEDTVPLIYAQSEAQQVWNPVLWARMVSNGRVIFDALGHDAASLNHPDHAAIICRSANWAVGKLKN